MLKIFSVLALILPAILQTIIIKESGVTTKLTSHSQMSSPQSFFENSSQSAVQGLNQSPVAAMTWAFLSDNSLGGSAKWVTPTKTQ